MAAALEEAAGTVCWWGLSPAIDLRLHLPPEPEPSVLLVGAAEGRHVLLTAARARRGPPRGITVFVAERSPEPVARQLLFLLLALEEPERPRPAARAAALLELLGSARLGPGSAALLRGAAGRLRRWVSSERHREPPRERDRDRDRDSAAPADLRLMRCRDRDALEAVLRRWERAEPEPGGAGGAGPGPPGWERRLRRRLGSRYEARAAVADWELRMALQPRGALSVSPAEFALWRESGAAFGAGGAAPNPTLLSDPRPRADGRSVSPPSYWGDIATGPFLSFGLEPAGAAGAAKTATEVSLGAVTALLHELLTGNTGNNAGNTGNGTGNGTGNTGNGTGSNTGNNAGNTGNGTGNGTGSNTGNGTGNNTGNTGNGTGNGTGNTGNGTGNNTGNNSGNGTGNGTGNTGNSAGGSAGGSAGDSTGNNSGNSTGNTGNGTGNTRNSAGGSAGNNSGGGAGDPPCEEPDPLGPLAPLPLRVRFLPLGDPPATPARLGGLCRLLVLGWRALPALTPALGALAAPGATLLLELPTFVPSLRPPELRALRARAAALARAGGFEPWGGPGEPPAHARFRKL